MKVFVTGGTGFVGSHLIDVLLERGHEVTALVRSPAKAEGLAERGVQLVRGDLDDHAALRDGARDAEVLFHVAALTGAIDEAEFLRANRDGTANLLAAGIASGRQPRFVLVSSMAAGGPARRGRPSVGGDPEHPVTMYGRSKLASEQVVTSGALPWTIIRPPAVYGPRDADNVITLFKAVRWGIAPIFGDGSMELSLVHVRDLAVAIARAGEARGADVVGRVFYANHPEVLTSAAFVRRIAATLGRRVLLLPLGRTPVRLALGVTGALAALLKRRTILRPDKIHEFFQEAWTGDPAPLMAATGWEPHWNAEQGLADTLRWYRAHGWL